MAMAIGRMLAHFTNCMDQNDRPDLVTCVPKHWLKRLVTGVNSAETLMDGLGMEANLPVAADLLICRRRIGKQSKLSLPARRRNMSGAWKVSKNYEIKKAHVVVVDDIMTTGATAHEVARVLKQAGARRVTVMAVARTIKTQ